MDWVDPVLDFFTENESQIWACPKSGDRDEKHYAENNYAIEQVRSSDSTPATTNQPSGKTPTYSSDQQCNQPFSSHESLLLAS